MKPTGLIIAEKVAPICIAHSPEITLFDLKKDSLLMIWNGRKIKITYRHGIEDFPSQFFVAEDIDGILQSGNIFTTAFEDYLNDEIGLPDI